jgi:hypothetical protein
MLNIKKNKQKGILKIGSLQAENTDLISKMIKKAQNSSFPSPFKGIGIEIFWPVFLPVYMHLGLNVNCFWF